MANFVRLVSMRTECCDLLNLNDLQMVYHFCWESSYDIIEVSFPKYGF